MKRNIIYRIKHVKGQKNQLNRCGLYLNHEAQGLFVSYCDIACFLSENKIHVSSRLDRGRRYRPKTECVEKLER